MSKVNSTIYISLFLLLVLLIWSAISSIAKPPDVRAQLTNGILDLRGMDLGKTIYSCADFERVNTTSANFRYTPATRIITRF